MGRKGEEGSEALQGAYEVVTLVELAEAAASRLAFHVHGEEYDEVEGFAQRIHNLLGEAEVIRRRVEQYVHDLESTP